jgi:hypothetical protein
VKRWIALAALVAIPAAACSGARAPAPLVPPAPGVVLADVTLVDPGLARRAHQTIRVTGAAIDSIAGFRPEDAGGSYAGSYVLPGLVDMHVHHPIGRLTAEIEYFGLLHLAHGVTSVRDCGSIDGSILETRGRVHAHDFAAPQIFACGPLLDGDPPFWPGAEVVRDAADGARVVDRLAADGVDCIKAYSGLSPDALDGIRAAAARHGLPLIGHVPLGVPFERAGLHDVQHLSGVPGSAPSPGGSDLIGALLAGWDEIDGARIDFVVRTSIEQGIAHTPTLVVIEKLLRMHEPARLAADPAVHMLPRYYRELLWKPGGRAGWKVPALGEARRDRILERYRTVVRRLHEAGVRVHVGTDTFNPFVVPGFSMHEELRSLVATGLTPEQALASATRGNAAALPVPGLGVLAAG